ncbi:hypothetical protein FEM03_12290 [Phragmitibacter flavus]|uniref:Uncharacterized protein n=1 Tax=Phragmitibacter flavus TaxID=2576071 RepID=A0A5R8KE19_9BACT|nr:glycoside hydrolase family 75 protein [Phragmitibacter flavus]TLD70497.1 hypothetical protein FEM03_12290 [Phragmitibacter flavus]
MPKDPNSTPPSNKRRTKKTSIPHDDDFAIPENWQKRRPGFFSAFSRLLLLLIVLALLVLPFTPYAGRIKRSIDDLVEKARTSKIVYRDVPKEVTITREVDREVIKEVEVVKEVPAPPPPLPSNFIPRQEVDVATLYNGITIQTQLDAQQGTYASTERLDKDAFTVNFKLSVRIPKANDTLPELARVNEHLPKMLPGFPSLLEGAKVSGFYHKLYDLKTTRVQRELTRLNRVLDRHNFFDTETILELTHPQSKRRALLIQSDMDVVADGSDGDRMPNMSASIYQSTHYQPSTSYEWAKKGKTQNPLLPLWLKSLDTAKKEFAVKGLSAARNAELRSEIDHAERVITGLRTRSSLIAEKDPFIVLSLLFRDYPKTHPHAPGMGDYAAVIFEDKIYPAICGDYGPTFKMGEASLRMAKTINENSSPYRRPVSDLTVTYLIFPGTAERPFGPPKLDHWHQKVSAYLEECGGLGTGYTLHQWEDLFAPPAPATPPAAPAPAADPAQPESPPTTPPATSPASATETPTTPVDPIPSPSPASPNTPPSP